MSPGLFTRSLSRVGSAGRITETASPSRQLQIALKWIFLATEDAVSPFL